MEAYFDYAATTKALDSVAETVRKVMLEDYGNPSARHQKGMKAEGYVKEARAVIAKTLRVSDKEVLLPPVARSQTTWLSSEQLLPTTGQEGISSAPRLNMHRSISP